jgi:hypothetical protein
MGNWARFNILLIVALPAFVGIMGLSVPSTIRFGLPGVNDELVYLAITINVALFFIVGARTYVHVVMISLFFSMTIFLIGPLIRIWFQTPESFSAYYFSKFVNMMTVIPAALGLVLSLPADDVERKLLSPGKTTRRWRKALILSIRVIRYMFFQVIPLLRERILEEATPYHCIAQIWKRDRLAGRPYNAILNIALFLGQFCGEVFVYTLGASLKNVDLWVNWINQVEAGMGTAEEA